MESRDVTLDGRSAPVTRRERADVRVSLCKGVSQQGLPRQESVHVVLSESILKWPGQPGQASAFFVSYHHCADGNIPLDKAGDRL
jgi:hypothetical protein